MTGLVVLLALVLLGVVVLVSARASRAKALERERTELEPVKVLAAEDATALGVDLQDLDLELSGATLDAGANADYQRALDAYESAKIAADRLDRPEDVRHVTEIIEDGRYAIGCVRARVAGEPLPPRRPPCFFDPRHGLSVQEVRWTPPSGEPREVPACALDAERVEAGAEPDTRKVLLGSRRVPYYEGGRAYEPYAAGYFGAFNAMSWMFLGSMMFGGIGDVGDGGGDGGDGGGGDGGGDYGDGGGFGGDGGGGGFDFGF